MKNTVIGRLMLAPPDPGVGRLCDAAQRRSRRDRRGDGFAAVGQAADQFENSDQRLEPGYGRRLFKAKTARDLDGCGRGRLRRRGQRFELWDQPFEIGCSVRLRTPK
jgi:hypothetical protein